MYSFNAFIKNLFGVDESSLMQILNLFLYSLSLFVFRKKIKLRLFVLFSVGIILTLFFSPHTLTHDLTVLVLPIFLIYTYLNNLPKNYLFNLKLLLFLMFFYPFLIFTGNVSWAAPLLPISAAYLLNTKLDKKRKHSHL